MQLPVEGLSAYFQQARALRTEIDVLKDNNPSHPELPAKVEVLGEFVGAARANQAYFDTLKQVRQEFSDWLLRSPEFHRNLEIWGQMDAEKEKKPYLQSCIDTLAEMQQKATGVKIYAGKLEYFHDPKSSDGYLNFIVDDNPEADVIGFNTKPPAPHEPDRNVDLLESIRTIAHEQWHFLNASLNRAVAAKRIGEKHPLHAEAVYFYQAFRSDGYISSQYDKTSDFKKNPYRTQLCERSAFKFGDGVYNLLRAEFVHGPVLPSKPKDRFISIPSSGPAVH